MITIEAREAKTMWQKVRGLLGVSKPYPLIFKTRLGIHTFGMRFPIDIVVLNVKHEVVELKQSIKPNRMYFWNPIYNTILELPAGTIDSLRIAKRDRLAVKIQDY